MLHKYRTLILGTMMGLGTLAFSGASASAAAMLPLSSVASGEANAVSDGIVQVKHKNKWHKKHYGNYCNDWYGGCNYYRRHHNFDGSYLFLPLIIGGGYGAYNYYDDDYYDDDYGYAGPTTRALTSGWHIAARNISAIAHTIDWTASLTNPAS